MQLIKKQILTATGLFMMLFSASCSGYSPVVSRSEATLLRSPYGIDGGAAIIKFYKNMEA